MVVAPLARDLDQSPLPSPLTRELEFSLFVFPAAAEAKLEVNGDGIVGGRGDYLVKGVGD